MLRKVISAHAARRLLQARAGGPWSIHLRVLSTAGGNPGGKKDGASDAASFQETLRRVQSEAEARSKEAAGEAAPEDQQQQQQQPQQQQQHPTMGGFDFMAKAKELYNFLDENIRGAYDELRAPKQSSLRRSVQQAESFRKPKEKKSDEEGDEGNEGKGEGAEEAGEAKPSGPSAIVLVKEPVSQWERMKLRLQGSTVFKNAFKNAKKFQSAAADTDIGKQAQRLGQSFREKYEDAREFYETSQNPLVYKVAGLISDMTAQTEEGNAQTAIMRLDPSFNKEEWSEEVRRTLAPSIIKAHLAGDSKVLKPWLGEAVYNKLTADIRIRKQEGITFSDHILELDENQVLMSFHEQEPLIVVSYAVQLINCIRNKQNEIVEGAPDKIILRFYSMAFQQVYDEDEGVVKWKVVDLQFGGDTSYL
jgi:import inner membrane translocase subunit TIM44